MIESPAAGDVGAVILCGGRSRRMGRAKAWLPFVEGEVLLQRVVRILSTVASPLVVVAAPDQDVPDLPAGVVLVRDPVSDRGPLQGLAAGLEAMPERVSFAYGSATDAPFLDPKWVLRLRERIGDHDVAIPFVGGYHHPLAALYRRGTVLPAIGGLLEQDRLRLIFLLETLRSLVLSADDFRDVDPECRTLQNLNTPDDYEEALRSLGS